MLPGLPPLALSPGLSDSLSWLPSVLPGLVGGAGALALDTFGLIAGEGVLLLALPGLGLGLGLGLGPDLSGDDLVGGLDLPLLGGRGRGLFLTRMTGSSPSFSKPPFSSSSPVSTSTGVYSCFRRGFLCFSRRSF